MRKYCAACSVQCARVQVCDAEVQPTTTATNKFNPFGYIAILIGVGCTNDAIPAPTQDGFGPAVGDVSLSQGPNM